MQSSVTAGVSSPVEQARQQPEESGDRSPARPKRELRRKLDARCSSAGEVTGSGSRANASTASVEDKTAERNLRVTLPAWLKGKHPNDGGNFVSASRAMTKGPTAIGSRNKSLAGGAEAAREGRQRQRLRSKARSPQEDGRRAESLAAGATES